MIARAAPYLVLVLIIAFCGVLLVAQDAAHDLELERIERARAEEAAAVLSTALTDVATLWDQEAAAVREASARRAEAERARGIAGAQLRRQKREDPDFRRYLDSPMHPRTVSMLWLPATPDGHPGKAPSDLAGADAQTNTTNLHVTHEDGWQWCQDVERALDQCNADKARLREWREGLPK